MKELTSLANAYGPDPLRGPELGITPADFHCEKNARATSFRGESRMVRIYLSVDDLIPSRGCGGAFDIPREASVRNTPSGRGVTINELLDEVGHITGMHLERVSHEKLRRTWTSTWFILHA